MNGLDSLLSLPPAAIAGIGALAAVQIVLDVIAFVDLARRPKEGVGFGSKWIWVAVILCITTIGAVIYLAAGRRPAPAREARQDPSAKARAADAADLLYGPRREGGAK